MSAYHFYANLNANSGSHPPNADAFNFPGRTPPFDLNLPTTSAHPPSNVALHAEYQAHMIFSRSPSGAQFHHDSTTSVRYQTPPPHHQLTEPPLAPKVHSRHRPSPRTFFDSQSSFSSRAYSPYGGSRSSPNCESSHPHWRRWTQAPSAPRRGPVSLPSSRESTRDMRSEGKLLSHSPLCVIQAE